MKITFDIAHEAPFSIMREVRAHTDYDYALVHLFQDLDHGQEYLDFFKESLTMGRRVILDNSLFELKEAFDAAEFAHYIEVLRPTEYIIPDAWHDAQKTVKNAQKWIGAHSDRFRYSRSIGVIQGKTYQEFLWCYRRVAPIVDKIAITFSYPFYLDPDFSGTDSLKNKDLAMMIGRQVLMERLVKEDIFRGDKPHHLLGCALPQEFEYYRDKERFSFIDTIDTSSPVVAGMAGDLYKDWGLGKKPAVPLYKMIWDEVSLAQKENIFYNIKKFRNFIY